MRKKLINLFFWKTYVMKSSLVTLYDFDLATALADHLKLPLYHVGLNRYPDGEIRFLFNQWHLFENQSVTIVHSTGYPVNDNIIALVLLADILKKYNARIERIIIPYFGYARQCQPCADQPGSVQAIISLLETVPCDQWLVVELHNPSIITLFSKPIVNVVLDTLIAKNIELMLSDYADYCVVAPDHGAAQRAESVARLLNVPLITCQKKRSDDHHIEMSCVGDVSHKKAIIIDDIVSTGATVIEVIKQLNKKGITRGCGFFVHPVFADDSFEQFAENPFFEKIIVCNTLQIPKKHPNVLVVDCSTAILSEL